jgi:O-methyltransferase involved in polyketide biosynthesis
VDKNKEDIPVSALYTAATWQWGRLPYADLVTPQGAQAVFRVGNAYMFLYRCLNPQWHSLKHTLLHRHSAINYLLRHAGCRQIIELAAGFTPRGSMVSADQNYCYFEVDLPPVVTLKRACLQRTDQGKAVLLRPNFVLREGDVTHLDFTPAFPAQPSFIITEGLMMYFRRNLQMEIWRRIAEFLRANGGEYVFDYLSRSDEPVRSVLGRGLKRLKNRFNHGETGFPCDDRGRTDIVRDLHRAGFVKVAISDSREIATAWDLPFPRAPSRVTIYQCT